MIWAKTRGAILKGSKSQSGFKNGRGGEGRVLDAMRGRSRMTRDPRVPTMPGRSTSGFHRPGRHCLNQARGELSYMKSTLFHNISTVCTVIFQPKSGYISGQSGITTPGVSKGSLGLHYIHIFSPSCTRYVLQHRWQPELPLRR